MQRSRGVPDVNAVCKEAEKYEGTKPARSERWQLLWATLRILDSFLKYRAMGGLWKTREGLFVFSKAVCSCLSGLCLRERKNRAGKLEWHSLEKYTLEQCILSPVYQVYIVINVGTERRVYLCSSEWCTAPPTVGLDSEDFWICFLTVGPSGLCKWWDRPLAISFTCGKKQPRAGRLYWKAVPGD